MKMNLTKKMLVYFMLVVLVSVLGFAYTLWMVANTATIAEEVNSQNLPRLVKASRANINASDQVAYLRGFYITGDVRMFDQYKKRADENVGIEEELLATADRKSVV